MPKLNDLNIPAALNSYLEPNEQLKNWAYGSKRSPLLILGILLAMILASLVNLPIVQVVGVFGFITCESRVKLE